MHQRKRYLAPRTANGEHYELFRAVTGERMGYDRDILQYRTVNTAEESEARQVLQYRECFSRYTAPCLQGARWGGDALESP